MRLSSARDLGLYIRDRRKDRGLSQTELCADAGVSRRWLSSVESGKPAAEIGLVLKVLHALQLTLEVHPDELGPDEIDLDEIINQHRGLHPRGSAP